MPTLTEIVTGLKETVEGFAASFNSKLAELNAARDSAIGAGQNAIALANSTVSSRYLKDIYVDPINGDDANDGTTIANAFKTWDIALRACEAGRRCVIYILNDIVADQRVSYFTPPSMLDFRGWSANGSYTRRKITFTDDPALSNTAGGIFSYSSIDVISHEIDYELAYNSYRGPFELRAGRLQINATNGTITKTGTGTGHLFRPAGSAHFEVSNVIIDPSASGHVVYRVAAGGNPNNIDGYSANFDQA